MNNAEIRLTDIAQENCSTDKRSITQSYLKQIIDYDPVTGLFRWKVRASSRARAGSIAGYKSSDGYVIIGINKVSYRSHRLAWLYMNGSWPDEDIDHIDGDRANNAIINLRCASKSVNAQNHASANSNSSTGLLGVFPDRGRFRARIQIAGKAKYLGPFNTPEDAHAAYVREKHKLHEGFVESRFPKQSPLCAMLSICDEIEAAMKIARNEQ